jgi:hypothetical protein
MPLVYVPVSLSATGNIIGLYILILKFLERIREDNRVLTE